MVKLVFFPSNFTDFPDLEPQFHRQRPENIHTMLEWGGVGWGRREKQNKIFDIFISYIIWFFYRKIAFMYYLYKKHNIQIPDKKLLLLKEEEGRQMPEPSASSPSASLPGGNAIFSLPHL